MNKYLPKQFTSQFAIHELPKNTTLLENEKKDVLKKLMSGITTRNITNSINAAIELHCSGYVDNVITKLTTYYFNEINITQPQCIKYIHTFLKYYNDNYAYKVKKNHPLLLINDIVIRNFITFFVPLILTCTQRKLPKLPKIYEADFDLGKKKSSNELISKDLHLVRKFMHPSEPKEIIIPISEICHHFQNKELIDREHKIIYWISWLLEYEKIYHNNNLLVGTRDVPHIDSKYHKDFIWIIWNIIKSYTSDSNQETVQQLFELYTVNYTRGTKKTRAYLIIIAVLFIINPLPSITFPIAPLSENQYKTSCLHSLRANQYYLKLFQHKTYTTL